jgi:hypothetical protein
MWVARPGHLTRSYGSKRLEYIRLTQGLDPKEHVGELGDIELDLVGLVAETELCHGTVAKIAGRAVN